MTIDCGEGRHLVCSGEGTDVYRIPQEGGVRFACACSCHTYREETSQADRPRDKYDRVLYRDDEVPPIGEGFGVWRGRVVTPDAPYGGNTISGYTHTGRPRGDIPCIDGWVPSGRWWLHCGRCRPYAQGGVDQ
jgi:hypothetical protein